MKTETYKIVYKKILRTISASWRLQAANGRVDDAFIELFEAYIEISDVLKVFEDYQVLSGADLDSLYILRSDLYAVAMKSLAEVKLEEVES